MWKCLGLQGFPVILLESFQISHVITMCCVSALHVAVQCGHVEAVRVLLTESSINAEAYNSRYVSLLNSSAKGLKKSRIGLPFIFQGTFNSFKL